MTVADLRPEVVLPAGTINLTQDLVPMVREWLERGLSRSFIRTCVRLKAFEPFSGGLKADLVGGLKIGVHAVLKLGESELELHRAIMDRANAIRPRTCVEVVELTRLDEHRWLMMMSRINASTLYDAVYNEVTEAVLLKRAVDKVFEGLATKGGPPALPGRQQEFDDSWSLAFAVGELS